MVPPHLQRGSVKPAGADVNDRAWKEKLMVEILYDSPIKPSAVSAISNFVAESLKRPYLMLSYADGSTPHKRARHMENGAFAYDKNFKPMLLETGKVRQTTDQSDTCTVPALIYCAGGRPNNCTLGELPQKHSFTFVKRLARVMVRLSDEIITERTVQTGKPFENQKLGLSVIVALNKTEQCERTADLLPRPLSRRGTTAADQ